jgi:hypothetical protein
MNHGLLQRDIEELGQVLCRFSEIDEAIVFAFLLVFCFSLLTFLV